MALLHKLGLLQQGGCRRFKLYEQTGAYSVLNTTGYGTPNTETSAVASVILTITTPDGVEYPLDVTADFGAVFPTVDDNEYITINNTNIGLSTDASIPSGIYTIKFESFDNTDTLLSVNTQYFLLDCSLYCCIDNLFSELEDCNCCDDVAARNKSWRYRMAYINLAAAKSAAACGKFNRAKVLLALVDDVCENSKCNCD